MFFGGLVDSLTPQGQRERWLVWNRICGIGSHGCRPDRVSSVLCCEEVLQPMYRAFSWLGLTWLGLAWLGLAEFIQRSLQEENTSRKIAGPDTLRRKKLRPIARSRCLVDRALHRSAQYASQRHSTPHMHQAQPL